MIELARTTDPRLLARLKVHPKVVLAETGGGPGLEFMVGGKWRRVVVGDPTLDVGGLIELMDNNPIVCASEVSVPSPGATLALIALGPLAAAGLIVEAPAFATTVETGEDEAAGWLAAAGWPGGLVVQSDPGDLGGAVVGVAIAAIHTPEDLGSLDELYAERYGRSFFVREGDSADWHTANVLGRPHAMYSLSISPEAPTSLLTVRVMADADGKAGTAQVVHAMNVMAGFEESLGIA